MIDAGDCKRDTRPLASEHFHAMLMAEFQRAITLSQYAANHHAIIHNQRPQHYGGTIHVMMHSIDFVELYAGQKPQN